MLFPLALLSLLAAPALLPAAWQEVRSGPFVVLSEAGGNTAQETAAHLEQFRHALGDAIGRDDLSCRWPITVVIRRRSAEYWPVVL